MFDKRGKWRGALLGYRNEGSQIMNLAWNQRTDGQYGINPLQKVRQNKHRSLRLKRSQSSFCRNSLLPRSRTTLHNVWQWRSKCLGHAGMPCSRFWCWNSFGMLRSAKRYRKNFMIQSDKSHCIRCKVGMKMAKIICFLETMSIFYALNIFHENTVHQFDFVIKSILLINMLGFHQRWVFQFRDLLLQSNISQKLRSLHQ